MTKQTDAQLNAENPLRLRSAAYGGSSMLFQNADDNVLNLMRLAGAWDVARVPYLKNEVVYHEGFLWACATDTSDEPTTASANWSPLTGISGLGGMSLSAPTLTGQDITAAWAPLSVFDSVAATERGVLSNATTDTFQFQYPGTWDLALNMSISHDSSQQGRTFQLRTFNVTEGVGTTGIIVGVGRNSEATLVNVKARFPVTTADVGDTFRIEIGNGSAITVDEWWACDLDYTQVGI